tara:strand:+ start:81 stop:263 length:183 start_codon:yes stop_codon:yes gene_type:complete
MDKKKNKKNTVDMESGQMSGSQMERQEQRKNITTPDNFKFGDMPANFRKRYLQMLREQAK